ncbi:Os02g0562000, partial [Oryza sativa Japonica Group]
SWRQSWVFPEADSPAISVTEAGGRPPERRRSRTGQPRESLPAREEGRRRRGFSGRGSCWLLVEEEEEAAADGCLAGAAGRIAGELAEG